MWNVNKTRPVIIGANESTSQLLRKHLRNIAEKHETKNFSKQPHWALKIYFGK
jgi:hypothetical protein